jgi:hypothetical protein
VGGSQGGLGLADVTAREPPPHEAASRPAPAATTAAIRQPRQPSITIAIAITDHEDLRQLRRRTRPAGCRMPGTPALAGVEKSLATAEPRRTHTRR